MANTRYKLTRFWQRYLPFGARRSHRWDEVRAGHIRSNPRCAVCNGTAKLRVHHIVPFSVDPKRELDTGNLITLCESKRGGLNCHLFVGHLGNWNRHNPHVLEMVRYLRQKIATK